MTVVVSFCRARGMRGNSANPVIGGVRVREDLELDDVSTATVQDGDVVLIGNAETDMIAVAFGTTPDADATAETADTSAGCPVPAGQTLALIPPAGSKISVKALA